MNRFLFNGRLLAAGTPIAGAGNRGLRYGDGLFETIRCRNGEPLFPDAHFARLWKGLNALGFVCPAHFTPALLRTEIERLLAANQHTGQARVRLQVFRGEGGLFDPVNHTPQYVIESWELEAHSTQFNSNGLVLGLYSEAKKSCDILANLKHCNFLPYALAALAAKEQQWNDALLLNQHDRICDSSIANIFMIRDQTVFTPSLSEGCVAGIMRQHLLSILPAAGFPVQETSLTEEDLLKADEIFLTNSIRPLRWVQSFGSSHYHNLLSKKIYELLAPTIG